MADDGSEAPGAFVGSISFHPLKRGKHIHRLDPADRLVFDITVSDAYEPALLEDRHIGQAFPAVLFEKRSGDLREQASELGLALGFDIPGTTWLD